MERFSHMGLILLGILFILANISQEISGDYLLAWMGVALIIYGILERMRAKVMANLFLTAIILFLTVGGVLEFSSVMIRIFGILAIPLIWRKKSSLH